MATLRVHNSLTPGQPVPFVPIQEGKVSWYACGPTVYDLSHLGHARNYVSTDIIRRIMRDYFGFKVKFVMNFTDIDDKIILRARRQRLLDLEKKKHCAPNDEAKLGEAAFAAYAKSNLPLLLDGATQLDETNYKERRDAAYGRVLAGGTLTGEGKPGDDEAKIKMHIGNMDAAAAAIKHKNVLGGADEILLPYLDSLYKETIDTSDQTIFTDLTQRMEGLFTDDMDALNVLRPDIVTRVTEYVPQIAKFVERIVDKGFAYETEGSVYFDITAFERAGNTYARLRPESRNDKALQEEGEGSLSKNVGGKRSPADFALWKKSKKGEPYWPSPWGDGRPGWHIECSVMASDVLGERMDMHSGGIDLAFPHHDNELAQSEAYFCEHGKGEHTWVNYFMHMGHLSISGSKMSKSLKNFQTIQDALKTTYTARGMRIVFLMGKWNDGVEISPDMRAQADSWETTINNFFTNTKALLAEANLPTVGFASLALDDSNPVGLMSNLAKAKTDLHAALSNSFDTPQAMRVLATLVSDVNVHLQAKQGNADLGTLEAIARWVTKIAGVFGLDENAQAPYDGLGWAAPKSQADPAMALAAYADMYRAVRADALALPLESRSVRAVAEAQDPDAEVKTLLESGARELEVLAMPYLRSASRLRDELRRVAGAEPAAAKAAILALADRVRDVDCTDLGVYLDDRPDGQPSLIKFVPRAELVAAREARLAGQAEKARQKEEKRRQLEQAEREKWERARTSPLDMFRTEQFAAWDAEGLPTKTKEGADVSKAQTKKMQKEQARQRKLHEEWLAKFGDGAAGAS